VKLVDDCKAVWKHYSTIALSMAGSLQGLWAMLDDATKANLPPGVGHAVAWITFTVALGGLAGKFIDQSPKDKP
jgi:hypothetical protein